MSTTVWAVVRDGRIEPIEQITLPEGSKVLVTLVSEEENQFWLHASQETLGKIWDNEKDDIYAELLKE